jgi:tetratricopeptide (TPR) repeat protein
LWLAIGSLIIAGILALVGTLQLSLDKRIDAHAMKAEELAHLPKGESLKPAMLGYHHLGADMLWLQLLQVLGKKKNTASEYEWIYHAVDVITTLDPQYAYAYYVGGVVLTNYANRIDLSNRLLEKGHRENPGEWNLPFLLGYNHYFGLGDAAKGAEYIQIASRTSHAPDFLPGLATRMYAEAGNPDVALLFLEALWKENPELAIREKLEDRAKEVLIERDLRSLDQAVAQFRSQHHEFPKQLDDLVTKGYVTRIPQEPFGGSYRLDGETGQVTSSTHPDRLKVFRRDLESGITVGVQ